MAMTNTKLESRWQATRIMTNSLPVPKAEKLENQQIAQCEHVKEIFATTRVQQVDKDFYENVCKRSFDAITNHPVLIVGEWRQGKSSLVNSLTGGTDAKTGRQQRTTDIVELHEMPVEPGSGLEEGSKILLADTPGLEPDLKYDIFAGYRQALERRKLSPDVGTGLVLVVIAATAQGVASTSSNYIIQWIVDVFAKARKSSMSGCTIQPVLTHADHCHKDDLPADKATVYDRMKGALMKSVSQQSVSCSVGNPVLEPIAVCNVDKQKGRKGKNIEELRARIVETVKAQTSLPDFHKQWSRMLTTDLERVVREFHQRHRNEETEARLFHRTVESVLATYQHKCQLNLEEAVPEVNWELLTILERKLRGEESLWERRFDSFLGYSPWAPTQKALMSGCVSLPFVASVVINKGPSGVKVGFQFALEKFGQFALKIAKKGH